MVNRDEVDQFPVVLNVLICLLDVGLQIEDIFLLSSFALEERLQGCFTEAEFFQLFLIVSLLAFDFGALLNNSLSAAHCVDHTLDIQKFTFNPDVALLEGVFERRNGFSDLLSDFGRARVSQCALANVTVCKVVDGDVLKFHEGLIYIGILAVTLLNRAFRSSNIIDISVHRNNSFGDKRVEDVDLLAITGEFAVVYIFRYLEVKAVLFENLNRGLLLECLEDAVDLTLTSAGEDFELF